MSYQPRKPKWSRQRQQTGFQSTYRSTDLRKGLASIGQRFSTRRKVLAIIPLFFALASYFVVPSFANYNFANGGVRYEGEINSGTFKVWSSALGGYQSFAQGYKAAGYWKLTGTGAGGGVVNAYCITLHKQHQNGDVLQDAGSPAAPISYILNNYYPAKTGYAGFLNGDANAEAAAVQLAIWGFSEDSLSHSVQGTNNWVAPVTTRALAIYQDAAAQSAQWATAQQTTPHVVLTVNPSTVTGSGSASAVAQVYDSANHLVNGQSFTPPLTVTFGLTGGAQQTSSGGLTQPVNSSGAAGIIFNVTSNVQITANLNGFAEANAKLIAPINNSADQTLAYPFRFPVTASASGTVSVTTPPPSPTITPPPPTVTPPVVTPTPSPTVTPGVPGPVITKQVTTTDGKVGSGTTIPDAPIGSTLTYALTYGNNGTAATGANSMISDDLAQDPLLAKLTDITPQDGGIVSNRVITWTIAAPIPAGSSSVGVVHFTAKLPSTNPTDGSGLTYCDVGTLTPGGTNTVIASNQACVHVVQLVCTQPTPTITITGPPVISPGTSVTYTIVATNNGTSSISASTVVVTVPNDFPVTGEQPSGTAAGQTVTFQAPSLSPGSSVTYTVTVSIPTNEASGDQTANVTITPVVTPPAPQCPPAQASTKGSVATTQVQALTTTPSAAPIVTPTTGIGPELWRAAMTGIALMLSGLVVLTGLRRNPHTRLAG